jgi:outer membrane lipopolysaccharide assembly protein LptE/RlpB
MKHIKKIPAIKIFTILAVWLAVSACGVYTFKDISIPPDIKTIKLHFIENKARYVNPQLSPRLTNKLQDKIVGQTRLTRTDNEEADWVVSGYISNYSVITSGISSEQASTNRLTVGAHIKLKDNKTQKDSEFDVTKSFEFNANQTLQQAEAALADQIIQGLSDEIFNRLFSNW